MICNICGANLADGTQTCPVCGAGLVYDNYPAPDEEATYVMHEEAPLYNYQGVAQNIASDIGEMSLTMPVDQTKTKIFTIGFVFSVLSATLMLLGLVFPAIDFTHFHKDVDLQYNLLKICKNVALISSMWRAIPIGFIIAIVLMYILAFVKIPIFRILPCLLAIAMLVLMLVDVGNIIDWSNSVIEKFLKPGTIVVNFEEIMKSFMYGIYCMVAGVVVGLISCFTK